MITETLLLFIRSFIFWWRELILHIIAHPSRWIIWICLINHDLIFQCIRIRSNNQRLAWMNAIHLDLIFIISLFDFIQLLKWNWIMIWIYLHLADLTVQNLSFPSRRCSSSLFIHLIIIGLTILTLILFILFHL